MNNTLANQFTARYFQLISDHKSHCRAIKVLEGEYSFKLDEIATAPPTYFFIDLSVADWIGCGWDIYPSVQ